MIDRYTKIVLTVIAACLIALVEQNFTRPAQAQFGGQMHGVVDQIGAHIATLPLPVHPE